jgi:hypothetical protein
LKWCHGGEPCGTAEAIAVVEKALAQPEQECPNLPNCNGGCFQCEYFNVETGEMEYPVAQPEQEPVAWELGVVNGVVTRRPIAPPQRTWVGLTDVERDAITDKVIGFMSCCGWEDDYAKAIESKLKELNT